ncbi:MAG: DUF5683 domain-containing protein [Bacteroidota bacterium]
MWSIQLVAQQPEKSVNAPTDTGSYQSKDTTTTAPAIVTVDANAKVVPSDSIGPRKHSPKTATLLSLCLPGAGQVYNRKNWWWKVPVIYGGGAALVYGAVFYNTNYKDFSSAYKHRVLYPDELIGDPRFDRDPVTLRSIRDSYREARDQCYIGLGVLYALQIVDAAVEAHFFDFNVSEDLSLNIQPQFVMNGPMNYSGVQLTLKLK